MSLVVFMKGVNVGGYRTLRPSLLAKDLEHLGVVNVGAAGTFIVTRAAPLTLVRAEFRARLPFETELILCRGREIKDLVAADPFASGPADKGVRRFVSVLARRPRSLPCLPIREPAGARWELKVVAVRGRFALSYWRKLRRGFLEPNGVVEDRLGVTSTTRSWSTIAKICAMLDGKRAV